MACFNSFLAVSSAIFFIYFVAPASGAWEITEPYPGHKVAIQGENITVTCVIVNFANDTLHDNMTTVDFIKVLDSFGTIQAITSEGDYSFENQSDFYNGVPRWNVTMVIHNMTEAKQGQYECRARRYNAVRYGFGISYIKKNDLPDIRYSEGKEVSFNEPVTLSCYLIKNGDKFSVKLVSIAWFKGDEKLQEIKHPKEESLKNLTLIMNDPEDAGTYKCQLTSILRHQRQYQISGLISVKVRPMFTVATKAELDDNEIIRIKGDAVTMNCQAKGNPINIVWKKQPRSKTEKTTLNQTGNTSLEYTFGSKTKYEGFRLEIPKTDYEDRGDYFCCIKSSNTSVPDQCQRFTLRVKDPLGYLWPLIGIIIEAILIIIILLIAAKFKSKKDETYKSDVNTELSYTITSEGSKGNIRLRNTGATAN